MGKGLIIFKVRFCHLNILNVLKCCFLPNAVCIKLMPPFQFFYLERVLDSQRAAAAKQDRAS